MSDQLPLFEDLEVRPTPAMLAGDASCWGCHWCGTIVYLPRATKPGVCCGCGVQDERAGWYRVDEPPAHGAGHYTGPFYRRLNFEALLDAAEEATRVCYPSPWGERVSRVHHALALALNVHIPESAYIDEV